MNPVRIYFWETGEVYAYHNHQRVAALQRGCNRSTSRVDMPVLGRLIACEGALYFFCRWQGKRSVVTPSTQALYQYYTKRAEAV